MSLLRLDHHGSSNVAGKRANLVLFADELMGIRTFLGGWVMHDTCRMNPTRAPSFRPQSRSVLSQSKKWPRSPASIELDLVVGAAVDFRGLIYVANRGGHPLLCMHPVGRLSREVGAGILHRSVAYDLRGPVPMPERYWLHGLNVDPWDNVWVTDVSRHLVRKLSISSN